MGNDERHRLLSYLASEGVSRDLGSRGTVLAFGGVSRIEKEKKARMMS